MADKKLESFKIGDSHRPTVSAPRRAPASSNAQQSEAASLGFRRIERALEDEEPGQVAETLGTMLQTLETYEAKVTSQREKAAAKKAIAAVERTADLMDYLFQTKAALQSQPK
jgi:hypothetical protein